MQFCEIKKTANSLRSVLIFVMNVCQRKFGFYLRYCFSGMCLYKQNEAFYRKVFGSYLIFEVNILKLNVCASVCVCVPKPRLVYIMLVVMHILMIETATARLLSYI